MSSALVRQALQFVDEEDNSHSKRGKHKTSSKQGAKGWSHPYKSTKKQVKQVKQEIKSKDQIAEENIKKLLALSKPSANSKVSEKIIQRAIKGKPLIEIVPEKKEEYKSILFSDEEEEDFEKFEKEHFCR